MRADAEGDRLPALVAAPQIHRRRADEPGDEHRGGPLVDLERRTHLFEAALVHHRDARAQRHRLLLVVRHVHHRRAQAAVEKRELGARTRAEQRIEVRQRLVEQERARFADDGAAERHALALAARELGGPAIEQCVDSEGGGYA